MQWPLPQFPTKAYAPAPAALTTGSPAHTKGAWVTLASGIPYPAGWVNLRTFNPTSTSGQDTARLLDLAVGTAGSETIVVPDVIFGFRPRRGTMFPLYLPANATLRGRVSGAQTGASVALAVGVYAGEPDAGLSSPGKITPHGVAPAASGGTAVTPSVTLGAKGAYAQLTAATTAPIHALMVLVQGSSNAHTASSYAVDIAVGGAGAETIVIPDHVIETTDAEVVTTSSPDFYPVSMAIPAGVRLAARCAVTSGAATQPLEVAVYGFTF